MRYRLTDGNSISGGGHVDTIQFLIDRGGDPNSQGAFKRTPLYRAAFAGHLDAVQVSSKCLRYTAHKISTSCKFSSL